MSNKDRISASHILIMHKESQDSRSDITKKKAESIINSLYDEIVNDKISFKDAAANNSDCSSGKQGGSLGEFGKGMMVKPFEEVVFSLDVNEVSKPFESDFGFHIAKRDS